MRQAAVVVSLTAILLFSPILAPARAQTVDDPALTVEVYATGIDTPTTMAFIGPDDLLVLQKNDGRVRRVIGGVLQPGEVLDVSVDNFQDKGLLGITLDPDFVNDRFVYLDFTEAATDGGPSIASRVYRYTWNGSQLVDPHVVLDLPSSVLLRVGGIMAFGRDDLLYTAMGDLTRRGKLQNNVNGADPDDTGVILRTRTDGSAAPGGPFSDATGPLAPMRRYLAYGIRNSFGLAFDPVTGALWDTENGQDGYDEVNRVDPGQNSGWLRIQGPDARSPQHQDTLWVAPGSHYADPKFSWYQAVAPTAIAFLANPKLGCARVHDAIVGDTNCGELHHFVLNAARDGFTFSSPELQDLVADNATDACTEEQSEISFGSGFTVVTDLKTGPDGNLYVAELVSGTIYRIVPAPSASDSDGDGVQDACDCGPSDPGAWSPTIEVPRLRVGNGAPTTLGWDAQGPASGPGTTYAVVTGSIESLHPGGSSTGTCTLAAGLAEPKAVDARPTPGPGEGFFYLVRAGNSCGAGTFGDSSIVPDPRDILDAALPPACVPARASSTPVSGDSPGALRRQ